MSVNEVKLKKAAVPFEVKGTGPVTARTFCIGNEDHTLGNAVRHVLCQNEAVEFAGYSVPHPADPVVQIRVQTRPSTSTEMETITAAAALKQACQTVHDQCDHVLAVLEGLIPAVKEDRIQFENWDKDMDENNDDYEEDEDAGNADMEE